MNLDHPMKMYFTRHLPNRNYQLVPCSVSVMTSKDYEDGVKLHDEVARGLSRSLFIPSSHEDIKRYLGRGGIALGVRFENRLVCFRTAKFGKKWVADSHKAMGIALDKKKNTAMTGFCVVDSEFRGNNIQFLSYYIIEHMIAKRFDNLVTTVAPKNIFSLQNVLACNFNIIGLEYMEGNNLRFILKKFFNKPPSLLTRKHRVVGIRNVSEQKRLLSEGYVGYNIMRRPSGFAMLYAPACDTK